VGILAFVLKWMYCGSLPVLKCHINEVYKAQILESSYCNRIILPSQGIALNFN
jgi:hypothetical protein